MIAHMIAGEAREYHVNLSRALASAYRLRPVTASIDPHLTIKAPFDALSTDIHEVELILERFVRSRSPLQYSLGGFGKFDDRVVYMDVHATDETVDFVREIRAELNQLPWIEFKPHEQTDVKLHATLCYPRTAEQAGEIVSRLTERGGKNFTGSFDTIALLKKGERRWEVYKEFHFDSSTEFGADAPLVI